MILNKIDSTLITFAVVLSQLSLLFTFSSAITTPTRPQTGTNTAKTAQETLQNEWIDRAFVRSCGLAKKGSLNDDPIHVEFSSKNLWPNGVVNYRLHSSLSAHDKKDFNKAVVEFHSKTCIRFFEADKRIASYVSIEFDDNVECGVAERCKKGEYQFARIGKHCRNVQIIIHILGHSICLNMESVRQDRDAYVNFSKKCLDWRLRGSKNLFYTSNGNYMGAKLNEFYDYHSQMHDSCGFCLQPKNPNITKCGREITKGLSILDADFINKLYDCKGCYRHRWVSKEQFTRVDAEIMINFARVNMLDRLLWPCRARFNNDLVVGEFRLGFTTKVCVLQDKQVLEVDFQVLTIPGGLVNEDTEYTLVNIKTMTDQSKMVVPVVAGHLLNADGSGIGNGYVAYAQVQNAGGMCDYFTHYGERSSYAIGTAWKVSGTEYKTQLTFCGKEFDTTDYKTLTCMKRR